MHLTAFLIPLGKAKTMTLDEVIDEITSEHKYYIGKMPQYTASRFLKTYREGTAKRSTVLEFIKKFGYVVDQPATYKKA